jgi:hypothetical protein
MSQYRSYHFAQHHDRHHNNPSIPQASHHFSPDNGPDITIPVDNDQYIGPSHDFAQYRHPDLIDNNPYISSHHHDLAPDNGPDITISVDNDQYRPSLDFAQYRHHDSIDNMASHHIDDDRYRPGQVSNVVHTYGPGEPFFP